MRLYFSWLMSFVFAFEPFLQARANSNTEKWTAEEFEQHIKASSLGVKGKTYNDLYLFMKMNLPPRLADRFAEMLLKNRDEKLPDIEFSKTTTREGHEGLKLILAANGLSHTVEIINDEDVFAKIDGVALTIRDLSFVTPAVTKITAKNPNLISKIAPTGIFKEEPLVVFNRQSKNSFYGSDFVVPTLKTWTDLPPLEQAKFIVELRRTWAASLEVENTMPTRSLVKPKNTALFHPFFIQALLVQEAFAVDTTKCTQPVPPLNQNSLCINSGYVGLVIMRNGGKPTCMHPMDLSNDEKARIPERYRNQELSKSVCMDGTHSCNTAIYGFERNSAAADGLKPICAKVSPGEIIKEREKGKKDKITVVAQSNQNATHYEGFCEAASPLDGVSENGTRPAGSQMPEWLKKIKIDPGNVDAETRQKIREGYAKEDQDKKNKSINNSARLVASRLNMNYEAFSSSMADADKRPVQRQKFLDSLVVFYQDINLKLEVCQANFKDGLAEKVRKGGAVCDYSSQLGACEQLMRRKLAMDYISSNICPKYFTSTGKPDGDFKEEAADKLGEKKDGLKFVGDCVAAGAPKDDPPQDPPKLAAAAAISLVPPPPKALELNDDTGCPPMGSLPLGMYLKDDGLNAGTQICTCVDTRDNSKFAARKVGDKYTCNERESSINPLIPIGIGAGVIALAALLRDRRKPANCADANAVRVGNNCYLPPACDTINYPDATLANKQCVLPTIPQKCYDGKVAVNGKCPCPDNFQQMPNGTCRPGFMCPYKNNLIVYDVKDCSEGGTTTPTLPSPGGVGTQ